MTSLTDPLNDDQKLMLKAIYEGFVAKQNWPDWKYVRRWFQRHSTSDAKQVRDSFPVVGSRGRQELNYSAIHYNPFDHGDSNEMRLTIASGLHLPIFRKTAENLVEIVQFFADGMRQIDPNAGEVTFFPKKLARLKQWDPYSIPDLRIFLQHEPMPLIVGSRVIVDSRENGDDEWEVILGEEWLIPYSDVHSIEEYTEKTVELIAQQSNPHTPTGQTSTPRPHAPSNTYVDERLIELLESTESTKWELSKLIAMLRELNANIESEHPYSSLALCRAIIDHVPPIFGRRNFRDFVSQFNAGTDKDHLSHLESHRFVSHDVLHRHISRRADLINMRDVPQRQGVNTLVRLVIQTLEQDSQG